MYVHTTNHSYKYHVNYRDLNVLIDALLFTSWGKQFQIAAPELANVLRTISTLSLGMYVGDTKTS